MSKLRVDQLETRNGLVTVDVADLTAVSDIVETNELNLSLLNVSKAIQDRKAALTSSTFRACTWNVQAFATLPQSTQFDNARFNGRLDSQQFVREHIEWLLRIGADVVGVQEFYGTMATKQMRSLGYTTVGSNWRMYPYIDSFMAIETVGKADGRTGFIGGNMLLTTRQIQNSTAHNYVASPTAEGTSRSWSRSELNINGVTVAIYNTHLSTSNDTASQIAQMAELVAAVSTDTTGHILLMGDWNNPDDTLFQPLVDLGFTVSPKVNSNNYPGGTWYYDRFVYRGFSSVSAPATVTPLYELGDHKPVYMDFTL